MRISDWSSDVCSSDLTASVQPHDAGRLRRAAEIDQFLAAQHQAADVAVVAARRVLEAEAALESHPPIRAAVQAHAGCVHGLVEQLHRSAERRAGKECGSTCRNRWSPYH